jgi:hypothetical protein
VLTIPYQKNSSHAVFLIVLALPPLQINVLMKADIAHAQPISRDATYNTCISKARDASFIRTLFS